MSKTNIVYKGVLYEDSFENYLNKESISICQFLYFLCIEDIAKYVERTYYTNKYWHFKYNVSSLIKLFIVKFFNDFVTKPDFLHQNLLEDRKGP